MLESSEDSSEEYSEDFEDSSDHTNDTQHIEESGGYMYQLYNYMKETLFSKYL